MTQRILWGVGTGRTMRAHWALHELSLPYDMRAIRTRSAETQTAEFTTLNSRRKIPVLQDGAFVITESAAIVAYLSDTYSNEDNALVPSSRSDRARWLEWCFFIMTELDATSLYVIRRHLGLRAIYGDAPTAVEAAKSYFSRQLNYVTKALSANPRYLMGEQFNTADILLTTCLTSANRKNISLPSVCNEYLERTTARAAYRAAYATNYPQVQLSVDIRFLLGHGRHGPRTLQTRRQMQTPNRTQDLLDQLIGAQQNGLRHRKAERLGSFEVHSHLEFDR